jgi:hypothetical protein
VALDLAVANLADGDGNSGRKDLRLAVRKRLHNGGGDDLGSDNLSIARLIRTTRGSIATRHGDDLNGLALGSPVAVVKVVKVTRLALVPGSRVTEGQRVVTTDGETGGVNGTGLGRAVELELVVGCNVSSAVLSIGQDTILQGEQKSAVRAARVTLHVLVDIPLCGLLDGGNSDLEVSRESLAAALRVRVIGSNLIGDTAGEGNGAKEREKGESRLHIDRC